MTHRVEDLNRREITFQSSRISEVLPEYFASEYPALINFLDQYYNFLDNGDTTSFKAEIANILVARDVTQTELKYLDLLLTEIGNGLKSSSFFRNPREMTRLLAQFYRAKGNLLSAEGFFKAFFNEDVTIEYPKKNIFIVNESLIGAESLRYIQDNRLYQVFSLLIKTGLSTVDYVDLYKKYVHPAGWFFAGEVLTEGTASFNLSGFSEDNLFFSEDLTHYVTTSSALVTSAFTQLTVIDQEFNDRYNVNQFIDAYVDFTVDELNNVHLTIAELMDPNSFKFDNETIGVDMSSIIETMDNEMYTRYLSDSTF
jgi:hypothetical protein